MLLVVTNLSTSSDKLGDVAQQVPNLLLEIGGDLVCQPANSGVGHGQASAGARLEQGVDLFPWLEEVPEVGEGADIDQGRAEAYRVVP